MYSATENPGLNNGNVKYVSFGYRCSSSGLLRRLGLREESHPFDWMVSRLPVIQHCIETDFSHFLAVADTKAATSTASYNPDSGDKEILVCDETVWHNTYYPEPAPEHTSKHWVVGRDTYAYSAAFNHHNMQDPDVHKYFTRCIERLRDIILSGVEMRFLYVHPIHDTEEHLRHCDALAADFAQFFEFIQASRGLNYLKNTLAKTRGIFVLPVRTKCEYPITNTYPNPVESVFDGGDYLVVRLQCNRDIVDAGEIWYRNGYIEEDRILRKISEYFKI
jgi:hypothetical protein